MNISPFLSVNYSCEIAIQSTIGLLTQAGLHTVQTFDLHAARAGLHDCPCPNHGMDECDCQMVVLLVYGRSEEPVALILHGNEGQTWLSIEDSIVPQASSRLGGFIKNNLNGKLLAETANTV